MREIKFRVWDKEVKLWIPQVMFSVTGEGKLFTYDEGEDKFIKEVIAYELMQFTGLTDKNGKEIYEGDIVNHHTGYHKELTRGEIRAGIEFPGFIFIPIHKRDIDRRASAPFYTIPFNIGKDLEVIGNIYENSELTDSKEVK